MSLQFIALIVPLGFVVLGGVFAVGGIYGMASWLSFRRRAVVCTGTVTELRTRSTQSSDTGSQGQFIDYPVLAFRTADGVDVQTVAVNGASNTLLEEGQQIKVWYDRRDPTKAYAGKGASARVLPVVFAVVGFGVLGLGGYQLVTVLPELIGG